jgi:hypothetical protein
MLRAFYCCRDLPSAGREVAASSPAAVNDHAGWLAGGPATWMRACGPRAAFAEFPAQVVAAIAGLKIPPLT